ncbi:oligosaccharide flippase family protein [Candidatus Roizmanbacteria bacterium]|nr:oligosaccharide flippase family protein [Candidatus Roizmanbacteria bacterium]
MIQRLLNFIKKPTSRDILINTIGNYLNVVFIAFFAFLLVRIISPAQYGVLSVLLGIAYVLANVLDFGTTATIYSYLPLLIEKNKKDTYVFIKTIFFYQTLFSLVIISVLFITFPYLDKVFFKTNAPRWELYVTTISVLFFIWSNFFLNILYASKKFLKANIYSLIANIIKTIVIVGFALVGKLYVGTVVFVFGIIGPTVFFILILYEKRERLNFFIKSKINRKHFRLKYTLTFFIATQFFNLASRMDLFLLSFYFPGSAQIGHYGLAQKIILTVTIAIGSITQVLSPQFSHLKTQEEVRHKVKTGFYYLIMPAGVFILLFLTPDIIFKLFFTEKFVKAASITKALGIPYLISIIGNIPNLFVLYTIKKPVYILWTNIAFLAVVSIGCFLLIPRYGVMAPIYVLTLGFIVGTSIATIASIYEYKKLPSSPNLK